jgi:5'-nucleotidase
MNGENPIVLVDMDGVLADLSGATQAHLESHGIPIRVRSNFYYQDVYPEADTDVINKLHASQNFFRNLPPVDGAIEGWDKIKDLGYEPRICSSPLRANEWCREEKLEWIEEHLGREAAKSAIIDKRKERYDGIAMIDDRPEVKTSEETTWRHVVFDAPYNKDSTSTIRLNGWHDPGLPAVLRYCMELGKSRL